MEEEMNEDITVLIQKIVGSQQQEQKKHTERYDLIEKRLEKIEADLKEIRKAVVGL